MKKYVFINDKTTSATMQNLQSAQQQAKTKHKNEKKRKESDTQKRRAINKYKSKMQKHLNFN